MELRIIKPKEPTAIAKITVQRTGKIGFSKGAMDLLDLEVNKFAKFAFDKDDNFYILMFKKSDEETFNVAKAGEYNYINAKSLLEDLEIDYKSNNTTIFDIRKTEQENVYKLNKRVIKK
ncbi:hypothetical protein JSO54_05785 [Riemerella anatipestifer]